MNNSSLLLQTSLEFTLFLIYECACVCAHTHMHVCDFVDILPCVPSPSLGPLAAVTGSPPDVPSPFSSSASDSAPLPKGNLSPATARMCRGVNVREPTPLGQLSTNGAESVDKCPGFPRLCGRFYIGFYTTLRLTCSIAY